MVKNKKGAVFGFCADQGAASSAWSPLKLSGGGPGRPAEEPIGGGLGGGFPGNDMSQGGAIGGGGSGMTEEEAELLALLKGTGKKKSAFDDEPGAEEPEPAEAKPTKARKASGAKASKREPVAEFVGVQSAPKKDMTDEERELLEILAVRG